MCVCNFGSLVQPIQTHVTVRVTPEHHSAFAFSLCISCLSLLFYTRWRHVVVVKQLRLCSTFRRRPRSPSRPRGRVSGSGWASCRLRGRGVEGSRLEAWRLGSRRLHRSEVGSLIQCHLPVGGGDKGGPRVEVNLSE